MLREKKLKYSYVCERQHASFTPLCIIVDGLVGPKMSVFIRRLSDQLATKWDRPYSIILNWVRTKISFTLVCATDLCIRGSRTTWHGMSFEDGLGINDNFL